MRGCMEGGREGRSSVSTEQWLPRERRQEIQVKNSLEKMLLPLSSLSCEL